MSDDDDKEDEEGVPTAERQKGIKDKNQKYFRTNV